MPQNSAKPNFEIVSKWYKFYFFEDYFECAWKSGFIKRKKAVRYKDIINISYYTVTVNFLPCHTFKFILNGQKNFEIGANFKKQLESLVPAIEYINSRREVVRANPKGSKIS